jgi:hypothetical protein
MLPRTTRGGSKSAIYQALFVSESMLVAPAKSNKLLKTQVNSLEIVELTEGQILPMMV